MKKAINIKSKQLLKLVPPKGYRIRAYKIVNSGDLAMDDTRWITIGAKLNRETEKKSGGKHVLIDTETGKIVGGFGAGKNIKDAFNKNAPAQNTPAPTNAAPAPAAPDNTALPTFEDLQQGAQAASAQNQNNATQQASLTSADVEKKLGTNKPLNGSIHDFIKVLDDKEFGSLSSILTPDPATVFTFAPHTLVQAKEARQTLFDWRNKLIGIEGKAKGILNSEFLDPAAVNYLTDVIKANARGQEIVNQLMQDNGKIIAIKEDVAEQIAKYGSTSNNKAMMKMAKPNSVADVVSAYKQYNGIDYPALSAKNAKTTRSIAALQAQLKEVGAILNELNENDRAADSVYDTLSPTVRFLTASNFTSYSSNIQKSYALLQNYRMKLQDKLANAQQRQNQKNKVSAAVASPSVPIYTGTKLTSDQLSAVQGYQHIDKVIPQNDFNYTTRNTVKDVISHISLSAGQPEPDTSGNKGNQWLREQVRTFREEGGGEFVSLKDIKAMSDSDFQKKYDDGRSYRIISRGSDSDKEALFMNTGLDPNQNITSDTQVLANQMGLNGRPVVLPNSEFDKYVQNKGATVFYRGVRPNAGLTSTQIQENTRYSDVCFLGDGIYGDGIYSSSERATARSYAGSNGDIMRFVLNPKTARPLVLTRAKYNAIRKLGYSAENVSMWALKNGYNVLSIPTPFQNSTVSNNEAYTVVLDRSAMICAEG